jgi:16S rRNA (uracil1498-N3)-methyltransferase
MPRFYCAQALQTGATIALPATAVRHVQVLRMQPNQTITLFNGSGGEFEAVIEHMGRHDVQVVVGDHQAKEREAPHHVHLAVVMPANDRMDWLVEKATELGVQRITPLMSQHSVLRLQGERADKKIAHWQAVAISACEQCGRNTLPQIDALQNLSTWLQSEWVARLQHTYVSLGRDQQQEQGQQQQKDQVKVHEADQVIQAAVLSLHPSTQSLGEWSTNSPSRSWLLLSGPEGGLTDQEDALARAKGFAAVHLGDRVLRAETAALAAMAYFSVRE